MYANGEQTKTTDADKESSPKADQYNDPDIKADQNSSDSPLMGTKFYDAQDTGLNV